MIDLVKKAMLTGIGMVSLTKEKIDEVARDFVEKGRMSEQEGKKLVSELMEKSEESKEELKKQIETMINSAMEKMDIASKSDMDEVKRELSEIKSNITKRE